MYGECQEEKEKRSRESCEKPLKGGRKDGRRQSVREEGAKLN